MLDQLIFTHKHQTIRPEKQLTLLYTFLMHHDLKMMPSLLQLKQTELYVMKPIILLKLKVSKKKQTLKFVTPRMKSIISTKVAQQNVYLDFRCILECF